MAFTPNVAFVAGTRLGAGSLNSNFDQVGSEFNGTLNTGVRLRAIVSSNRHGSIYNSTTETIIGSVFISGNIVNNGVYVDTSASIQDDFTHSLIVRIRAGSVGTTSDPVVGSFAFTGFTGSPGLFFGVPLQAFVSGLTWTGSNFISVTGEASATSVGVGVRHFSTFVWGA